MKKSTHPDWLPNYEHHMNFYHPPLLPMPDIPVCSHYGSYMVKRKFDVHTGVDLYAADGTPVFAIEAGEVVKIRNFTGKVAGCDHWEPTFEINIEGYTGSIGYGEMTPNRNLKVGDMVNKGD